MKASIFTITKITQNDVSYLNVDLIEGLSGDNFSFKIREGRDISEEFLDNFKVSYIHWQTLKTDTRMPWSNSLIRELKCQVSRYNNYNHYIADIEISDIMSTSPRSFLPSTTILEASNAIVEFKISGAPVVDGENNLVGIISEKDIMSALFEETISNNGRVSKVGALETEAMNGVVGDIMIRDVLTVGLHDEITPALRVMQNYNLRRMPVLEGTKLIGIISIGDIHRAIFKSIIE